jgi:hypothetical protein
MTAKKRGRPRKNHIQELIKKEPPVEQRLGLAEEKFFDIAKEKYKDLATNDPGQQIYYVEALPYAALYESKEHYRLENQKLQQENEILARSLKSIAETVKQKDKDFESTLYRLNAQILEQEEMIDALTLEVCNYECEGIWVGVMRKIFGDKNG